MSSTTLPTPGVPRAWCFAISRSAELCTVPVGATSAPSTRTEIFLASRVARRFSATSLSAFTARIVTVDSIVIWSLTPFTLIRKRAASDATCSSNPVNRARQRAPAVLRQHLDRVIVHRGDPRQHARGRFGAIAFVVLTKTEAAPRAGSGLCDSAHSPAPICRFRPKVSFLFGSVRQRTDVRARRRQAHAMSNFPTPLNCLASRGRLAR